MAKGDKKTCSFDGCDRPVKGNGLCNGHYQQQYKGLYLKPLRIKIFNRPDRCIVEGCDKPHKTAGLCAFHFQRRCRTGSTEDPRQKHMKVCEVPGCDEVAFEVGFCHDHRNKDRRLKRQFGIGVVDYTLMLNEQDGLCKICSQPERIRTAGEGVNGLAVDHCHETGKVRGLLCHSCNTTLGKMNDNPHLLRAAAAYIERHRCDKAA